MPTTYRSKIGLELALPIGFVLGGVLVLTMWEEPRWLGPLILLPIMAFIAHMFATTRYTIDGQVLIIRSGFTFHERIDITAIKSIRESNDIWSSPAASMDRLKITYGRSGMVLISPKQKRAFVEAILAINPAIEVRWKK